MKSHVDARRVVTVDGPSGSGKSTLGRRLAIALRLPLIDTGLFYRAVMVAAVRAGVGPDDREALIRLARHTRVEINTDAHAASEWQVHVDGADPGDLVRDPSHALLLSRLSQISEVRAILLEAQRRPAVHGAVAVGRDCGTVVFPDAAVKLYLRAPESVRLERRAAQLGRAHDAGDSAVHEDVTERDRIDASNSAAAPDAVSIDTGGVGIEEMVELALRHCAAAGLVPEPERR